MYKLGIFIYLALVMMMLGAAGLVIKILLKLSRLYLHSQKI
jgi:hypothetical protein